MIVRTALPNDAPALVTLVEELGYSATSDQMTDRLESACSDPQQAVFVAVSGSIVGWIQVARSLTLEGGVSCEIRGLVVAKSHRGLGIGRQLVAAAESCGVPTLKSPRHAGRYSPIRESLDGHGGCPRRD